jgi:DNA-binding PadR family transcriptional regulator
MDHCEKYVITACGLYLLAEEKRKKDENTGFIKCFEQERRKENFRLHCDICKMTGKNFSNILE